MNTTRICRIVPVLLFAGLCSAAQFVQRPAAVPVNDTLLRISFSVDASTDVEIGILSAAGRVVCHLAAGVLGGDTVPPPPLGPGLIQALDWNRRDDDGRLCTDPLYTVRVRLGVTPVFDTVFRCRDMFPATYLLYPGGLDPRNTYRDPATDSFLNLKSYTGVPLYEQENRLDFNLCKYSGNMLVCGVAQGQGLELSSATVFRVDSRTGRVLQTISGPSLNFGTASHYPGVGREVYGWRGQEGGYYYTRCCLNLYRFTLQGAPAPWPGTGTHIVQGLSFGDLTPPPPAEGPDSTVYAIHYAYVNSVAQVYPQAISKIRNGVVVDSNFIVINGSMSGGVRVDKHGNIYVGARVKELHKKWPDFVNGDSLSGSLCDLRSQQSWAYESYGSIIKFGPAGGSISNSTAAEADVLTNAIVHTANCANWENYYPAKTRGVQWMHYGMSHILTHTVHRITNCWCAQTRFDVDRYDRVFYPNTFMAEFCGMDNNRNILFKIKNRDIPEVAIGVGHEIEATDDGLFVADYFNNQIVRFDWRADAETTLSVPGALAAEAGAPAGRRLEWMRATPNPFKASVNLILSGPLSTGAVVRAYDLSGRCVADLSPFIRKGEVVWSAAALPGGVYVLRALKNGVSVSRKIVYAK